MDAEVEVKSRAGGQLQLGFDDFRAGRRAWNRPDGTGRRGPHKEDFVLCRRACHTGVQRNGDGGNGNCFNRRSALERLPARAWRANRITVRVVRYLQ